MSTTTEQLRAVMDESRNGTDGYTRHPFNRMFLYTSGVKEVAELAGAYWLLDIIATEVAIVLLNRFTSIGDGMLVFTIVSHKNKAVLSAARDTGAMTIWSKRISYTDFPEGEWKFYLCVDGILQRPTNSVVMMLPKEY